MSGPRKPHALSFDPAGLPPELAALPQFVGWHWEFDKQGRWTKVLKNPGTGRKASTTNPGTWSTLAHVLCAMPEFDWDGVGFVFTTNDDYFGIDIDDGYDAAGNLTPETIALIERFGTYAEPSVRRKGVHLIGRTRQVPNEKSGDRSGPRECYWERRFFTLTGAPLPGYDTIAADCTEEFLSWHAETFPPKAAPAPPLIRPALTPDDETIIERVLRMTKGRRLHGDGDLAGLPSGSEADLTLCNCYIAAGATDPEQIDRLYRDSALYPNRPKWTRDDYREITIAKALNGQVRPFDGWSTNPIESPARQAAAAGGSNRASGTAEGDATCEQRVAALETRIAELQTQLAAARADNTALVHLMTNTDLNPVEVRAAVTVATEALAKRDRGEVDDDGRVRLSSGEISRDYRPKPPPGERLAPTNSDGTRPRLARANVRPVVEQAIDRGLIEATPIQVERSHSTGAKYTDTEWAVTPPVSLAAALRPWGQWHPAEPKTRKPRTVPAACPECGEVHAIRRTDSCTGCGAIVSQRIIEPAAADPPAEAPAGTGDKLSPVKNPAPLSVTSTRIGRSFISGPPTESPAGSGDKTSPLPAEPAWLADAPDPSYLPGFEPTPLDPWTDVAYGGRRP